MKLRTHWIALRFLGLLLLCLLVTLKKLPASVWGSHAFPVTVLAPPPIDLSQGPMGLPTSFSSSFGPDELADVTIDVALAWRQLPIQARSAWLEWLCASPSHIRLVPETLDLFQSVAAERLAPSELSRIERVLSFQRSHPPPAATDLFIDYLRPTSDFSWYIQHSYSKHLLWLGFATFLIAVSWHHIRQYHALRLLKRNLDHRSNP